MKALIDHYRSELQAGRLAYQHCLDCAGNQAFIRRFCVECGSRHVTWRTAGGIGTVASVSVLHRAPTPEFRERVPYAILLIDLDEGMRVMTHGHVDLAIGDKVRLGVHPLGQTPLLWASPSRG